MSETLTDFLAVLWPSLPSGLRSNETHDALQRLAAEMAPIPNVALEFHSLIGTPGIDLQQRIRRSHGEAELLLEHLRCQHGSAKSAWSGLRGFCEAWLDPTACLSPAIAEIYLEYDLPGAPAAGPPAVPSVFLVLEPPNNTSRPHQAAREALELLAPSAKADGLIAGLERGFAACPAGAHVGAVGLMLGRSTDALRINLKRVRLEELAPLLSELRWQGPLAACKRWAAWAFDRVDRVTVALDLGRETWPHLSLECILLQQPAREPRWEALLGELTELGLCSADAAFALLRLPGTVAPPEASVWPAQWIAASLLRPQDQFSTLERRLYYVKLTVAGEERVAAKVYGGAGHVWRHAGGAIVPDEGPLPAPPALCNRQPSLARAAAAAAAFLLKHQEQTGRWWDFELPAGASDEWVTAFVGTQLAAAPEGRDSAARAWEALLRRRSASDCWGYNRLTPTDADSTAWALRLASRLGQLASPRAVTARRFLEAHVLADGGVATYAEDAPIRRYTRLPAGASMSGWQAAHPCVAAAAGPFLGQETRDFLRRTLAVDRTWRGYWWWDDEYTTALAVETLRDLGDPADEELLGRTAAWAMERIGADGAVTSSGFGPSPFATGWAVHLLADDPTPTARRATGRAVAWLVQSQLPDGSWPASARLRVAMPGDADPTGSQRRFDVMDHRRLFTTTGVLAALSRYQRSYDPAKRTTG